MDGINPTPPLKARRTKHRSDMSHLPVGGRLFKFRASWKGAAHESIITQGLSWSWAKTPPPLKVLKQKESAELDLHMIKLNRKRVIEKAKFIKFQSQVFTIPKRDSLDRRWIMDLSILNDCIKCPKFRMLTLREVRLLLPKGFWTVALDLQDGFWHLPVSRRKRPFLGFRYRGQFWQFRAMPFGLNIAPRLFTKVMAHMIKIIAAEGIFVLIYLDDLLIIAPTRDLCLAHMDKTLSILESFGWIINENKSRKLPAQIFDWLGVHFDLQTHTVCPTESNMGALHAPLQSVIQSEYCTKRELMRLQGLANWVGQTNPITRLMLSTTKVILRTLRRAKLDARLILTKGTKLSLAKWLHMPRVPQLLGNPSPTITIQTDASLTGWGFQIDSVPFQGTFDKTMPYSINALELLTIWFALLTVESKGQVIQILCDNSAAIAAIRRGSSPVFHLSMIAELIWRRAAAMNWTLFAYHIQGRFNVLADQLSRNVALSTEWALPEHVFRKLSKMNPELQIDLFATRLNHQLPLYISPCPDESAIAVDAMTVSWEAWNHLYLYPPSSMISKALPKLLNSRFRTAILVTPEMPSKPWYMTLTLHKIPSTLISVRLQQVVVDRVVFASTLTKLRVWKLSKRHTRGSFRDADKL